MVLIASVLRFGVTGVDVFFCLSGFLITGILYDSLPEKGFFRKFYARRVLRIFPLYYGVLFCVLLTAVFLGKQYHLQLLSLALYLQNTGLIAQPLWAYSGPSGLPLPHFWSLAVEEQFYCVWPVLVFLLRRRRAILGASLSALVICPVLRYVLLMHGYVYYQISQSTLCRADSLLAGAALAMLLRGALHDRTLRIAPWLLATGVGIIVACSSFGGGMIASSAASLAINYTGLSLASAGLLGLAMRPGRVRTCFSARVLRTLGKYSYGLYVLHLILFVFLRDPLREVVGHFTTSKLAGVIIPGLGILAASMLAAYLSYQLYEKRFLRLKRYFDYDRAGTRGVAA